MDKQPTYDNYYLDIDSPKTTLDFTLIKPILKTWDLIHTRLDVVLQPENQTISGFSSLWLVPFLKSQEDLYIDAKYMKILNVFNLKTNEAIPFQYDSLKIHIHFLKPITDTLSIRIMYSSESKSIGLSSFAITDNKGIYFINPQCFDSINPSQVWTQGETESSSRWFPTLDDPSEKTTQEIHVTYPIKNYKVSLSNGLLKKSVTHDNKYKTDSWYQSLPHSPYLAVLAAGNWDITSDSSEKRFPIQYYTEPLYTPYVKTIYGNTPEMIKHFEQVLGYNYPWEKFTQVSVRDFVSGAMENTSAVIHGDFLNHDARQHLENSYEDVISHELFHHWFGDLVTCENWGNLTLNEGFATYGEYIWRHHKYGKNYAEALRMEFYNRYVLESQSKKFPLIRTNYTNPEELFDAHSYQKGALILHALRNFLGDTVFFNALKYYLNVHSFSTVEFHDLRLAMEKICGCDLTTFFYQWYQTEGHPEIQFEYNYNSKTHKLEIGFHQNTQIAYNIPIYIQIKTPDTVYTLSHHIINKNESVKITCVSEPLFVIPDPGKNWLIEWKTDYKPKELHEIILSDVPLIDKLFAIQLIQKFINADTENQSFAIKSIHYLIQVEDQNLQNAALTLLEDIEEISSLKPFKQDLQNLFQNSPIATIRNKCILLLSKFQDADLVNFYIAALHDSSYSVITNSLAALIKLDSFTALTKSEELLASENINLVKCGLEVCCWIGQGKYASTLIRILHLSNLNQRIPILTHIGNYMARSGDSSEIQLLNNILLKEAQTKNAPWYYKYYIKGCLESAWQIQVNSEIRIIIQKAIASLPESGSIRMELR